MNKPTVALVDPLWIGHHPMYFGEFGASLLRNGTRVVGFCPEPEAGLHEIRQASGNADVDATCHLLKAGGRSVFNGRFEGDPWHTLQRWQRAAKAIHDAELEGDFTFDLVYFPYLDSYLRFLPFPGVPEATIGRTWSGLYLRNHHHRHDPGLTQTARRLAKGDRLISSESCLGIGVLDERYRETLKAYTTKPVTAFPDVTLTDLPEQPGELTREILQKARGRKIIGLIGLEQRKGAFTMLQLARRTKELRHPWYFVFAGSYCAAEFTPSEQEEFARLREDIESGGIDHVHFDPNAPRIPAEPDYNSLFSNFDVAWAAYLDFPGSSGTLSKAAAFEIPVIATEGECIGERVHHYRLGRTIAPGDVEEAETAIAELLADPGNPDYAAYRANHCRERLDACLQEVLTRLPRPLISPQT
jgi:glycosyltransferase involved in cell wall biosynthesis